MKLWSYRLRTIQVYVVPTNIYSATPATSISHFLSFPTNPLSLSLSLVSVLPTHFVSHFCFCPHHFFFQVQLHRLPPFFRFFGHGFLAFGDIKKKKMVNEKWVLLGLVRVKEWVKRVAWKLGLWIQLLFQRVHCLSPLSLNADSARNRHSIPSALPLRPSLSTLFLFCAGCFDCYFFLFIKRK